MDVDRPSVIVEKADQQPHESSLARAIGPEHTEYPPFRHGELEAVQYLSCAVAEREVIGFDYGGGL